MITRCIGQGSCRFLSTPSRPARVNLCHRVADRERRGEARAFDPEQHDKPGEAVLGRCVDAEVRYRLAFAIELGTDAGVVGMQALGIENVDIQHVSIVRSQFAYPIYDPARDRGVARIRDYLRRTYPSLHPIGRNGMHRYDNQDHAMLSAMQSVDKYFGVNVDPWQVNTEPGYHEAGLLQEDDTTIGRPPETKNARHG